MYETKNKTTNMKNDFTTTRGRIRSEPRAPFVAREVVYVRRQPGVVQYNTVINSDSIATPVNEPRLIDDIVRTAPAPVVVSVSLRYSFAKTARRADILYRAIASNGPGSNTDSRKREPKLKKHKVGRLLFGILAVIVLAATGYIGFDTWQINNHAEHQITQTVSALAKATVDPKAHQAAEGTDEKPLPDTSLKDYHVAASLPRALYISKLGIAARVLPMGVNPDGSVQAPLNIYDSGWYSGSVQPGQIGAVFIDGHASGPTHFGLFGNLYKLTVGDTLQIEKGDGTRLTYKVVHTEVVDKDKVDMKSMLLPYGKALRGLNLMTCAGEWVQNGKTLSQRVLVYTEQI